MLSPDRLTEMLDAQRKLQEASFKIDFTTMTDEERVNYIRWNVLALTDELHEALNEVGWKPWATKRYLNREAYVGELIDAWHFLMNLLLVVDADADELFRRYHGKRGVNAQRQAKGYDGITGKCPACHRDLKENPPLRSRSNRFVGQGGYDYECVGCGTIWYSID